MLYQPLFNKRPLRFKLLGKLDRSRGICGAEKQQIQCDHYPEVHHGPSASVGQGPQERVPVDGASPSPTRPSRLCDHRRRVRIRSGFHRENQA